MKSVLPFTWFIGLNKSGAFQLFIYEIF